jgi:hypothetical protein
VAALHQGVDIALSPSLLKAVFGRELRHAVAVERGQILLRELAPLRPDLREDDLLGLGGGLGFCRSRIGSNICHVSISKI